MKDFGRSVLTLSQPEGVAYAPALLLALPPILKPSDIPAHDNEPCIETLIHFNYILSSREIY